MKGQRLSAPMVNPLKKLPGIVKRKIKGGNTGMSDKNALFTTVNYRVEGARPSTEKR